MTRDKVLNRLSERVLGIHRRNGGALESLDPSWPLLDPRLNLDSLDLAEVMASVERDFGVHPFEDPLQPPRTWEDILRLAVFRGRPPGTPGGGVP
jgi:acyl carrier protein